MGVGHTGAGARTGTHDSPLRVTLLGRLTVGDGVAGQELGATTNKGLVLSMLAARCNEVVSIDDLADAMWPDRRPKSYRVALRVVVLGLRTVIEPDRVPGDVTGSPIVGHADGYELRLSTDLVDAGRFERLVREGRQRLATGDAANAASAFRDALALWGEPFAGADCPAVQPAIERLRLAQRAAVTGLLEADVQLGQEDLADVERAVDEDPFDERRWGHLMIALFRRDRQADALATFQRARRFLIDEIGVEPGQYLRRVEEQILLQDGALLTVAPSAAGRRRSDQQDDARWPVAPRAAGPLLLRDDELRSLDAQLGRWRLVTIVGPPGVGKTTLASAVAASRPETSVAWVSLGDVPAGPGAVIDMTTRLGVVSEVGAEPIEYRRLLSTRIGDRPMLLVLDNVEHLVAEVADLAAELLRSCPNVSLLMTSRRPVGLLTEQVFRLAPFSCSDERIADIDAAPSRAATYLGERSGLVVTDDTARADLERIGAHVGGLALGLEQAAACLQVMSPAELAQRLDLIDDPTLTDGLSRAISWSIALLDDDASELLRALAHLDAPWDMGRAEAVGVRLGLEQHLVPRIVARLFDHSLIVGAGDSMADPAGPFRRIVEPVRQHVRHASLAAADPDRYPLACARTILADVIETARLVEGADQRAGLRRMRSLMPDIRRTVIWSAEAERPDLVAGVLAQLRGWWWTSGLYADGQTLHSIGDPVVERWSPTVIDERIVRLRALTTAVLTRPGFAAPALRADDLEQWLEEAIDFGAPPSLLSWIAQMLSAGLSFTNRDAGRAEKMAVKAIEDGMSAGEQWLVAWGRYALAIARARTDPIEGLALFEQAISAFSTVGDQLNAARITMFLGHGSRIFGDTRGSDEAFTQAEQWCADLGAAPVTQLDCELGRAQSADTAGRSQEAANRYRSLIPRMWEFGDYRCAAVAQRSLAAIIAADGDLDGASALVARAMETLRNLDAEESELAITFLVRSEIAEARRQFDLAARLLGQARALAGGSGVPVELRDLARIDALADRLTETLGAPRLEQLEAAGREDRFL